MGLDQYAEARKGEPKLVVWGTSTWTDKDGNEVEEEETGLEWEDSYDLAAWRKHPNLQGWMEEKWREKGCPVRDDESGDGGFNGIDLELTKDDLLELQEAVGDGELPPTGGFMFGGDSSESYRENDQQFVKDAIEAIEEGYTVVYRSSW